MCIDLDDKHFDYLQDSLNSLISMLYRFDLATVATIDRELQRDLRLRKVVKDRTRTLDDCHIPEVHEVRQRSLRIAVKAFFVNSGPAVFSAADGCALFRYRPARSGRNAFPYY
jgi:hypothetical protein